MPSLRRTWPRTCAGLVTAVVLTLACCAAGLLGARPAAAVPGQFWISKLSLTKAWRITRGAGVTVAVIDSGVPPTGDLGARLLAGHDFVTGSSDGRVDTGAATAGGGYPYSHGQNMAELIAGSGAHGLTGIAPDAKILPLKISVSTAHDQFSESNLAAAIHYAVDRHVQVINLSLGENGSCDPAVGAQISYAYQHDVVVVAASGNESGAVSSPANCPGVLAVAGVDSGGTPWGGSNTGPDVDFGNFAVDVPLVTLHGPVGSSNGTSEASAFTSGEIALLRAKFPNDSARAIITRLLWSIDTLSKVTTGSYVNQDIGYGIPVPLEALQHAPASYAKNLIYDRFARQLGAGSGNSSAPATSSASSNAPQGTGASGGGISTTVLVVVVVVVVLILLGVVLALVLSRSRRRPPPGYGPPGFGR